MAKKTAKKTATAGELRKVEAERARELQTMRRLKRQQTAIVETARAITRIVRRADLARLDVARELCEDTPYGLFGREEVGRDQAALRDSRQRIAYLEAQLAEANLRTDAAQQFAAELQRDLDAAHAPKPTHA